jgi:hypothetical protein
MNKLFIDYITIRHKNIKTEKPGIVKNGTNYLFAEARTAEEFSGA